MTTELMTPRQAAIELDISTQAVYGLIARGRLRAEEGNKIRRTDVLTRKRASDPASRAVPSVSRRAFRDFVVKETEAESFSEVSPGLVCDLARKFIALRRPGWGRVQQQNWCATTGGCPS